MRNVLLWLWMLTKRLYKKPTFLVILLLIPCLCLAYGAMSREDSGVLTIALAQEAEDPISEEIFTQLQTDSRVFCYRICRTPQEAEELVKSGNADAAWIFPGSMQARIDAFLENPDGSTAFIRVVQREENVALMLTRERLTGALYHHIAQRYYISYVRAEFPEVAELSDEELMVYYNGVELTDQLFTYDSVANQTVRQDHYLLSPVRGLLAVVIMLCGLASAMYYIKDSASGTFGWLSLRVRPLAELGCQTVALLNVGIVALISLLFMGIAGSFLWEIVTLLLYALCVAAFCMMLRALFGSIRALGAAIPLLVVVSLLVCPVFFDLGALRAYQFLLPATYYINGAYNPLFLAYMGLYTLVCFGLYLLFSKVFKR